MVDFDYIKDPQKIYARSFEAIDEALAGCAAPDEQKNMIKRMIHACGIIEIIEEIEISLNLVNSSIEALKAGATILCDCEMVRCGINTKGQPVTNPVLCTLNASEVSQLAQELATTRSAAAVQLWKPYLHGAIVVIGNAPTALFALLEMLDKGASKPAAIFGFPVGFVGAMEAKRALAHYKPAPFATLHGRMGGSAIASAAFNGLLKQAREVRAIT